MKAKKIIFMFKKFVRDFSANKHIDLANDFKSEELSYYYIKFGDNTSKLNRLISSFDKNGVPLNSAYIDVENKQLHYYPISIGQFALSIFHANLTIPTEDKKAHFMRIADWFYDNRIEDEKLGCYWLTEVDKPEYHVYKAWKSAFTQSRALSVLARAWQLTGDDKYLKVCEKSLRPFQIDINNDGVSVYKSNDKDKMLPFFEEYVADKATRVLDGHIFSLFGLYDFIRTTKESDSIAYKEAQELFNDGVSALIDLLPEYDMGYWVRFNLCELEFYPKNDPCTIGYLRLIIKQLLILHEITGVKDLKDYSLRFKKYDRLPNIIRMYFAKFKALKKLNRL